MSEAEAPAPLPVPALKTLPANGLALTPPMGWNSWNYFRDKVDDATVRQIADAMVASGMRDAGYKYINIDDTWEGSRDAQGNIVPNKKFPDMKALADYVHSKGLKLGIYSSPGPYTCAGYLGSYGHEVQDAKTYAKWGIDYLKYDWCSAHRIYNDTELRAVYQKMGQALEHSGRPIVFSLCEYGRGDVWTWGPKVGGNLWRTTGDISDHWDRMAKIGFNQSRLAPYAAPGHWNDPDMLEVGNGHMSIEEYRTHFSLWCLLAAPLIAGNDLRHMTPEIHDILVNREAIAVDQDKLGKQGQRIAQNGTSEIWAKPLSGGAIAVGLFNRSEQPAMIHVSWKQLGLSAQPHHLRDLWAHKNLAVHGAGYAVQVPAHGVALLRVTR
jgi:alpha-galactosidase